ncbi:hypothetical protein ACJIZ3_004166 [Penstemon smallii]|uniref:Trichome birefringence-like C-terminal domain-containing protein n=1 Tax=Penstemon smallii TaxID=265156 RepID=A0ABD3S1G9_9LAMI
MSTPYFACSLRRKAKRLLRYNIKKYRNGVSSSEIELHLDILDNNWTEQYKNLDYMILSIGKWIFNAVEGCHYIAPRGTSLIASNHKGTIFYRTSASDYFRDGEDPMDTLALIDTFKNLAKIRTGVGKSISECLHCCVPGPIDYWNDLLMENIVNGRGN